MNYTLIVTLLLSFSLCMHLSSGQKDISCDGLFISYKILTWEDLRQARDQRVFENFHPRYTRSLEELRRARDLRPFEQLHAHYAEKYNIPGEQLSPAKVCELHTRELEALINMDISKTLKEKSDK